MAATAQATVTAKSVRSTVVRYGDLNLASQADSQILLGRIKAAARKVCGLRNAMLLPIEIQWRRQAVRRRRHGTCPCRVDAAAR
jgi:UrcA family protein